MLCFNIAHHSHLWPSACALCGGREGLEEKLGPAEEVKKQDNERDGDGRQWKTEDME